jgi:hypothetical protein
MLMFELSCLHIKVGERDMGYAIHAQVLLNQWVTIQETKEESLAATWQTQDGQVCSADTCIEEIRTSAKNMADEFVNDFLKANESK